VNRQATIGAVSLSLRFAQKRASMASMTLSISHLHAAPAGADGLILHAFSLQYPVVINFSGLKFFTRRLVMQDWAILVP
jgi:hypothetical protein